MAALVRTKRIAWALALTFSTLVLTFSYVSGRRYLNALRWVEHTHAVSHALEALYSQMVTLESETRGYLITGDAALLANTTRAGAVVSENLGRVRELVRDNPSQVARTVRLEQSVRDKLALMTETAALREQGARLEAEQRTASQRGKALMAQIQFMVGEMDQEEQRLLEQRQQDAEQTQCETVGAIGAGALTLVLVLAFGFVAIQRDARERRDAALELAESEERYRALAENVSDLVTIHAPDGELTYVSPSVEALLGVTPALARTLPTWSLVHPEDAGHVRYNLHKFEAGEAGGTLTCRLRRRDGEYRWFEFRVTRVADPSGQLRHFQAAGRDVTVRRELERQLAEQAEELRHLSLRDGLTGLYNRRGFVELSAQIVRMAEREKQRAALLFVDLDGLKIINDELGHGHGDGAICEVAELLRTTCRATDLVARLGGDEFVVLAGNVEGESVDVLKARLTRALEEANRRPGRQFSLSFSLGVAFFDPQTPVAIEQLLAEADARMYEAKAAGKRPRVASTPQLTGMA
jgi:diguanylate cyclase (GGDEF)-like protein/PAS domain S-box-containing protein